MKQDIIEKFEFVIDKMQHDVDLVWRWLCAENIQPNSESVWRYKMRSSLILSDSRQRKACEHPNF